MRVLLDECVPRRLRGELPGHDVRTVREMGWGGKRNGELLKAAVAEGFQIFLTVDRNLKHQQDWPTIGLVAVVLVAFDNSPSSLVPLMSKVSTLLPTLQPGRIVEVTADAGANEESEMA
jgi:hypothetical protein